MVTQIKNVVFDIGNVIVRWSPVEIMKLTFGDGEVSDSDNLENRFKSIFQSETWMQLNKGFISVDEAKAQYQQSIGLTKQQTDSLFYYVTQTQILLYGSVELLKRTKAAGYNVYALTDNVHEIVSHLKSNYDFWDLFDGAIVSAEVGLLKPQAEIYQTLLEQFDLQAEETVFLDDMPHNVKGAQVVGMKAIQFKNAIQCEADLKALGVLV